MTAALVACGGPPPHTESSSPPAPSAAERQLPACGASVPGADLTGWHEVTAQRFVFCVPGDWREGPRRDTLAAASGEWRGTNGWVRWAVGPFKPGPRVAVPFNERATATAWIGGREAHIDRTGLPQSYTTTVRWPATRDAPVLRLVIWAPDRATSDRYMTIANTVRFTAP
jgi:hypothetical protein